MSGFWESILKAETKIGMNDNFFELGGHSLLAMRLAMALRCDVRTIMVNPTVSSLLEHLSDNVDAIDTAMDALIETLAESDNLTQSTSNACFSCIF